MNKEQHIYDVVVRSLKTGLAVLVALQASGLLDILKLPASTVAGITSLSVLATALLNIGIKVNQSVKASINAPVSVSGPVLVAPTEPAESPTASE